MCELVIKTAIKNGDYKKMNDTEILEKVKDWLKSNLDDNCFNLDIEEDNKALLDAIEDWKKR
jgi:hypothetical protein